MNRTRWQRWSWTAWMAVFGLVCAPTLSHALAAWQGQGAWIEVCSAQGTRRVHIASADAPAARWRGNAPGAPMGDAVSPGAEWLHHLSHCPLCGLSGAGMAPAPMAHTALARRAGQAVKAGGPALPAPTSAPVGCAQPRGPPAMA